MTKTSANIIIQAPHHHHNHHGYYHSSSTPPLSSSSWLVLLKPPYHLHYYEYHYQFHHHHHAPHHRHNQLKTIEIYLLYRNPSLQSKHFFLGKEKKVGFKIDVLPNEHGCTKSKMSAKFWGVGRCGEKKKENACKQPLYKSFLKTYLSKNAFNLSITSN